MNMHKVPFERTAVVVGPSFGVHVRLGDGGAFWVIGLN